MPQCSKSPVLRVARAATLGPGDRGYLPILKADPCGSSQLRQNHPAENLAAHPSDGARKSPEHRAPTPRITCMLLLQDLRLAVRMIRKSPGASIAAATALALAIGVNASMFSVADAFLLKPLSISEPRRRARRASSKQPAGLASFRSSQLCRLDPAGNLFRAHRRLRLG